MIEPNKRHTVLRMTLSPDQITGFVADLHQIQEDMIESVVESKARQNFPEAQAIINYVKNLK